MTTLLLVEDPPTDLTPAGSASSQIRDPTPASDSPPPIEMALEGVFSYLKYNSWPTT